MGYEQFLEQVREDLQMRFPYMNVEIRHVDKLQGESYTGIAITPDGSNAGATMNLHSQYDMLQSGVPMEIVMQRIGGIAADAVEQIPQVSTDYLSDYGQMKDSLIMQAVSAEKNNQKRVGCRQTARSVLLDSSSLFYKSRGHDVYTGQRRRKTC